MYYLYHIPGKKIGVTCNLNKRVTLTQGYSPDEYEVLDQSDDIDYISEKEIELQKSYGYKVDRKKYNELLNIYELLSVAGIERFNIISETYRSLINNVDYSEVIKLIKVIIQNVDEYNNLINYCNKQLAIVSYTYNLTVQQINFKYCSDWEYKLNSNKFTHNSFKKIFVDNNNSNNSEASCSYH